jgi:hypothetical protein
MAPRWTLLEEPEERNRAWDAVAESCGYATFFHTRAWAELFGRTFGTWDPDPVVVEFSDGRLVVLPMMRRLDSEHRQSTVPGTYGGPLFGGDPTQEHWDEFDQVPRWFRDILIVDNPYSRFRWEPNGLVRWRFQTHVTTLTGGFDGVWRNFREEIRAHVQEAERSAIDVRVAGGALDAREYFGVYKEAIGRPGDDVEPLYPAALFENLLQMPVCRDAAQLLLAYHEGRVVGGQIVLYWGDTAVAWHTSIRPGDLAPQVGAALFAAAMRKACDDGLRWFDFLASGHADDAGLTEGYGGVPWRYDVYWSPGLSPDSTRLDTGLGAAGRIPELRRRAGSR